MAPLLASAQLVGDLVERGPPGTDGLVRRDLQDGALRQTPPEMTRQRLDRLARILEAIHAVLADGLQRPITSPARPGHRQQQTLIGQPRQNGGNGTGGHPARTVAAAVAVNGPANTDTRRNTARPGPSSSA
jgi:hypothetical protein